LLELGWEYSRDGMIVGDCRTGDLVEANPAAERLTGYSRQELLGMHQSQLHPPEGRRRSSGHISQLPPKGLESLTAFS